MMDDLLIFEVVYIFFAVVTVISCAREVCLLIIDGCTCIGIAVDGTAISGGVWS